MVVPSGVGPSVRAGTMVPLMAPGVNTRASVNNAARGRPGGRRDPWPAFVLPAGKPDARPVRQQWCRARHGGVTVNTGTGEPRSSAAGGPAGRRPAPGVIMESWIAWLVLAALLGLAEIMTTTLAFGLLAVAAAVAAVVGGFGLALPFQLIAFALAAGAGLGIVRPIAM